MVDPDAVEEEAATPPMPAPPVASAESAAPTVASEVGTGAAPIGETAGGAGDRSE